ncbi:MAG TPA: S8 family serine peptidase [Solirubrobacterales bacterium]|nr:S8 family serine peptidase [Solirubrobacterales bacterium]
MSGAGELLEAYSPLLRYHEKERFRATRVESLVEAAPAGAALPGAVTELRDGEGERIASTDSASGLPRLCLDLLRGAEAEYPGTRIKPDRRHFLAGDLPQGFAFTGPPIAYGRAWGLDDGDLWLQYWLFSYDNPHYVVADHQGDWELIQLKVDPKRAPGEGLLAATCFQHGDPDGREGGDLEQLLDRDGRLPIMVARGSHASYFDFEYVHFGDQLQEKAPAESCRVIELDESAAWLKWPGYWGKSMVMDHPRSPRGPGMCRDEWADPQGQHEAGVYTRQLRLEERGRVPAVMISTSAAPATGSLSLIVQGSPEQPVEDLERAVGDMQLEGFDLKSLDGAAPEGSDNRQLLVTTAVPPSANPFDVARALESATDGEWEVEPDLDSTIFRPSPNAYRICDVLERQSSDPRWPIDQIGCPAAWKDSRGAGVLVGHPDTGYCDHPELSGAIGSGYDVLKGDADPRDVLTGIPPAHFPGHGTGTASLIASRDRTVDLVGAAPEATVLPFRVSRSVVLLRGSRLLEGIRRAREADCRVISISLGGLFLGSALRRQLDGAVAEGRIVIAAAGQPLRFVVEPASYASTIGVGGSTFERTTWQWTARGASVDICAPAARVMRADAKTGELGHGDGTSFSTALTAGVAALWFARHREELLAGDRSQIVPIFRSLLTLSAQPGVGANWKEGEYGAGIIDAAALMRLDLSEARPEQPPAEVSRGKRIIKWLSRLVEQPVDDVREWIDKTFDGSPEEAAERVGTELASLSSEDESVRRSLRQATAERKPGLPAPLRAQASDSLRARAQAA